MHDNLLLAFVFATIYVDRIESNKERRKAVLPEQDDVPTCTISTAERVTLMMGGHEPRSPFRGSTTVSRPGADGGCATM